MADLISLPMAQSKIISFNEQRQKRGLPGTKPIPNSGLPVRIASVLCEVMVQLPIDDPECFFLVYGSSDENRKRTWHYLNIDFSEAELNIAVRAALADLRKRDKG